MDTIALSDANRQRIAMAARVIWWCGKTAFWVWLAPVVALVILLGLVGWTYGFDINDLRSAAVALAVVDPAGWSASAPVLDQSVLVARGVALAICLILSPAAAFAAEWLGDLCDGLVAKIDQRLFDGKRGELLRALVVLVPAIGFLAILLLFDDGPSSEALLVTRGQHSLPVPPAPPDGAALSLDGGKQLLTGDASIEPQSDGAYLVRFKRREGTRR